MCGTLLCNIIALKSYFDHSAFSPAKLALVVEEPKLDPYETLRSQ